MASSDADKDDIADALARMADGAPSKPERPLQPPGSAAEFRGPGRPVVPGADAPRSAAPTPAPSPAPPPAAKPKPPRPDRPDRPAAPPSAAPSDDVGDDAAQPDSTTIIDDDDSVIVPAPAPEVFAPHAPAKKPAPRSMGVPRSLAFRRTVIPILLTCGVLLIGIGLLRWIGGADSIFGDMSIPLSAALCGCGAFLLVVAALNMLQVKAELAAARDDKVTR